MRNVVKDTVVVPFRACTSVGDVKMEACSVSFLRLLGELLFRVGGHVGALLGVGAALAQVVGLGVAVGEEGVVQVPGFREDVLAEAVPAGDAAPGDFVLLVDQEDLVPVELPHAAQRLGLLAVVLVHPVGPVGLLGARGLSRSFGVMM